MDRRHVAFLRGVGPAKKAPGDALSQCFEAAGYRAVRPVLATGNVIFAPPEDEAAPAAADIETLLESCLGRHFPVVLRSASDIAAMMAAAPFKDLDLTRQTRLVCMLPDDAGTAGGMPRTSPEDGFRFAGRSGHNLFLVRDNDRVGTPQIMAFLDRRFGKRVTTRNWSTIERIAALLG